MSPLLPYRAGVVKFICGHFFAYFGYIAQIFDPFILMMKSTFLGLIFQLTISLGVKLKMTAV